MRAVVAGAAQRLAVRHALVRQAAKVRQVTSRLLLAVQVRLALALVAPVQPRQRCRSVVVGEAAVAPRLPSQSQVEWVVLADSTVVVEAAAALGSPAVTAVPVRTA